MYCVSGPSMQVKICLVFTVFFVQSLNFAAGSRAGPVAHETRSAKPAEPADRHQRTARTFDAPVVQQQSIRTIEIDMSLISFSQKSITVTAGETVRFLLRNTTEEIRHEFTIGTPMMQNGRRALLEELTKAETFNTDQEFGTTFDGPNAIVVLPGETKELIWTFTETQSFEFGCNIPGHYEAGMKGEFKLAHSDENEAAVSDADTLPDDEQPLTPKQKVVANEAAARGADLASHRESFVQLEVQRYLRAIKARRRYLLRKHRRVLRERRITIEITHKASGGKHYKLGVGGFRTTRAALRLCQKLRRRGSNCLVRTTQ